MKRGEIYYVFTGKNDVTGSEQRAGRPAVIVSNNSNNEHSETVEVVYLTRAMKKELPTHVLIHSASFASIVLCEQVTTVSKERIGDLNGECTTEEMERIDIAIQISLGLKPQNAMSENDMRLSMAKLEAERDTYKELYTDTMKSLLRKKRGAKE